MKKLFLAITAMMLLGCSKDEPVIEDPIIGKWYLKEFYRNDSIQVLSECALSKSFEFRSNGYYYEAYFKLDTLSNHCVANGVYGGKWEKINNK
ncbi:lipocalin-like domain-containing protein [Flavobacterium branchiophilum]|uniref:Lipocalin-like domain-containing protein n=1 Tax=Flavobacterium branchiophilum TaxID=55197 RepID=A0A2H3KVT3_9FLAO|nr:lipocalin family protein [Flavobacterium branchiophilum]PDS24701.1 hypothetical protein B0A77_07130 [Flavobacterium branchiophilum]